MQAAKFTDWQIDPIKVRLLMNQGEIVDTWDEDICYDNDRSSAADQGPPRQTFDPPPPPLQKKIF